MIKGNIEIFQSYGETHKSLYTGSNMVVDGFRKTVADVMTYMPNPSATPTSMEPGVSSVSSYQIQAMTLGSAKEGFSQRDSRFWYSGLQTSASNYQLLPLNENATFEMWDCYSSIGFNQWKYDNAVEANLLINPTLKNSANSWTTLYQHNNSSGVLTQSTVTLAEGEVAVTKFELVAGQQQVTLRQRIPQMKLGGVYTFYTNGKAHNATMDMRISRGRNGVPLEYYDFEEDKFKVRKRKNLNFNHIIQLKSYYEVDQFRVKLRGQRADEVFSPNNEFFVEYIFPSAGFTDTTFAPWDEDYVNPFINILRLEVCDEQYQILRNPNFLEHQSVLINNDFDNLVEFPESEVLNPTACAQLGLYETPGWQQLNPLAQFSHNPADAEVRSTLGAVFPFASNQAAINNDLTMGVALYASSMSLDSSGAAVIEQNFTLGNEFRNDYAFLKDTSPNPDLLDVANGQYDNNATLMLSFDTAVSGEAAAADCGTLQIKLIRNSDDFEYNFEPNRISLQNDIWTDYGSTYKVSYDAKNSWTQKGAQVILPAGASQETYRISITGTGRTDGTNGFCYYLIKNLSFGPLAGWRTYVYDNSGIAKWSLSSTSARVKTGKIFSGLTLSATKYDTLADTGSAYEDIRNSINGVNIPAKTQLAQNFVGLEPTKSYRLAVKGTSYDPDTLPSFAYTLKAKARAVPKTNNYNVLSTWMKDNGGIYSVTNTPNNLNPYYTNTEAHRATHPFFSKSLNDRSTTPLDWGLWVTASGSSTASSITSDVLAANAGVYALSMKVFNSMDVPSYFALSSQSGGTGAPTFFNWDTFAWDTFIGGTVPAYRNSVSASYFLPLPAGANTDEFTSYTYPHPVTLPSTAQGILRQYYSETPDGLGSRGNYRLTAAVCGPNAEGGHTLVSDLALKGPGLDLNVDIWKELYYDWGTQVWQPTPTQDGDLPSDPQKDAYKSFVSTPKSLITGMCLYGLDRDTVYQLNIIDTSGGNYSLHDISLQDISLVSNSGKSRWIRDASVWTSEPYGKRHYTQYNDGAVFKFLDWNNGVPILTNQTSPSAMTDWLTVDGITFNSTSGHTGVSSNPIFVPTMKIENESDQTFAPWLTQSFTLGEYNLKGGDNFAVGLEAICKGTPVQIKLGAAAVYDGDVYTYNPDSREWSPGAASQTQSFTLYNRNTQEPDEFYADAKTWNQLLSKVIVAPPFGDNTKIVVSFVANATNSSVRDVNVKNFKVYTWVDASSNQYHTSGPTFNFPEFPSPQETTLQSVQPSGNPGELGQFLNRINYFEYYPTKLRSQATAGDPDVSGLRAINNPMAPSITGEKTLEEAITMGAYLPSAGLFFGSGTYGLQNSQQPYGLAPSGGLVSGVLNQMGVVNSDGYIYRNVLASPHDSARDASAGFIVSSYLSTPANTYSHKTLRYVLKLHKDDWRFLDYYMGGLGALGLNSLDYKKSYKKLGTAFQISGTGTTYDGTSRVGLYKIADPSRNPVFNLTNKKVTFPPGLKIDYDNTDHITIIWDINY